MNRFRILHACLIGATLSLSITVAPASAAATRDFIDFNATDATSDLPTKGISAPKGDWIAVSNVRWDVGKDGVAPIGSETSGAGAGRVSPTRVGHKAEGITVTLAADSKKVFDYAVGGKELPTVRLVVLKTTPTGFVPYLSVLMRGVVITSVEWKGDGKDKPAETVTLNYAAVKVSYNTGAGKPGSPATIGWDITQNKMDLSNAP